MLTSQTPFRHYSLHVAANSPSIVCAVIHVFWLLLALQSVSASTVNSYSYSYSNDNNKHNNNHNYYADNGNVKKAISNLLLLPEFHIQSQQLLPLPLPLLLPLPQPTPTPTPRVMDNKALTGCGGGDSNKEDMTNWQPVCATTTDSVDYVLFSSECLLRQTNRVQRQQQLMATGESRSVFKKIAMGHCRPNCTVVICESNEEPFCAQNLRCDELRHFSGQREMARDVCLHDNEWKPISIEACTINSATTTTSSSSTTQPAAKPKKLAKMPTTPNTSEIDVLNNRHSTRNVAKRQTKKVARKSIPCPKVFNPVCAELFGVKATFINECLVNAENVKYDKTWLIVSEGVCAEDYASSDRHKNAFKKRNVTEQLNRPNMERNQHAYLTHENVWGMHGRQVQVEQKIYIRILPEVDDRVVECKFGVTPVCGSSTHDEVHHFDNICALLLRNIVLNETWIVVNDNKCIRKQCILNCTTHYDPYCITRNEINYTILNQCHVDYAFCRYEHKNLKILGKGECKSVLENIAQHEEYENTSKEYPLRLVRKVVAVSPAEQKETTSNSFNKNASLEEQTTAVSPVQFVTMTEFLDKESSTSTPLNAETVTSPSGLQNEWSTTKSHIMNLWQSTEDRRRRLLDKQKSIDA